MVSTRPPRKIILCNGTTSCLNKIYDDVDDDDGDDDDDDDDDDEDHES